MLTGGKAVGFFETGGHTAGVEAKNGFERIGIHTAAVSLDEHYLAENLVGTDRPVANDRRVSAQDKAGLRTEGGGRRFECWLWRMANCFIFMKQSAG